MEDHFRKLERMYLKANINQKLFESTTCSIQEGKAQIGIVVDARYHHALGGLHGSVYFKLMDDAAFFAVQSLIRDQFILTANFQVQFLRPFSTGRLIAYGEYLLQENKDWKARAFILDEDQKILAKGDGNFRKSGIALTPDIGYK